MTRFRFAAKHSMTKPPPMLSLKPRLWANGRICPHCGVVDKSGALRGKTDRVGSYKCYACRKKFTVKVGTIFRGQPRANA